MKKDFYQDFNLEEDITKCEIISSSIEKKEIKNNNCKLLIKVKIDEINKENFKKNMEYQIETNLKLSDDIDAIDAELLSIDWLLISHRLTIFGDLEIKEIYREKRDLKYDPFKQKLINSFVSLKRSNKDLEVISTFDEENKKNDELEGGLDLLENVLDNKSEDEKEDQEDNVEIVAAISNKKENNSININDSYVPSWFYYRIGKNEKLTDVINKFELTMEEFIKYNPNESYQENSLVKIKRK